MGGGLHPPGSSLTILHFAGNICFFFGKSINKENSHQKKINSKIFGLRPISQWYWEMYFSGNICKKNEKCFSPYAYIWRLFTDCCCKIDVLINRYQCQKIWVYEILIKPSWFFDKSHKFSPEWSIRYFDENFQIIMP